ncbi:RidA family protein [uncultured Roseivirga sp.]|uniref:RidA family protein n=1 Tax=uncultured Roseivirga sp. TaxID=543088 RepID=UPI0030D70A84|tara:strand:+ start:284194 stop:284634 length:441 start_codon:yes stop_codon:yes gene_type:complete
MSAEKKFLSIPEIPPQIEIPGGNPFQLYRIDGSYLYLSGHGPSWGNDFSKNLGKVGIDLTTDQGYNSAKICMLNLLQTTRAAIGSLDRVESIIEVFGMVNSVDDYTEHSKVINGASELLEFVFKDKAHHTRVAMGANSLPFNFLWK